MLRNSPAFTAGRGGLPRPWHRRQHGDLRARRRSSCEVPAGPRARAAGAAGRSIAGPIRSGSSSRPARSSPRAPSPGRTARASTCRAAVPPSSPRACGRAVDSSRCWGFRRFSAGPSAPRRPAQRRAGRPVAVISYAFWQRRFGGEAGVIGRTLTLDRVPVHDRRGDAAVIPRPHHGRSFDVAVPIGTQDRRPGTRAAGSTHDRRGCSRSWRACKPGQTIGGGPGAAGGRPADPRGDAAAGWPPRASSDACATALTPRPAAAVSDAPALRAAALDHHGRRRAGAADRVREHRQPDAGARQRGATSWPAAGPGRLALPHRPAAAGRKPAARLRAALGLLFAQWGSRLIVPQLSTPRSTVVLDLALDWRVVVHGRGGTGPPCSSESRRRSGRGGPTPSQSAEKEQGSRGSRGRRSPAALSSPLVVVQVALSLVLVVAAGLFVRSWSPPSPIGTWASTALPSWWSPSTAGAARSAPRSVPASSRARSGSRSWGSRVAHAAASSLTPVSGMGWNSPFEAADRPDQPPRSERDRLAWGQRGEVPGGSPPTAPGCSPAATSTRMTGKAPPRSPS